MSFSLAEEKSRPRKNKMAETDVQLTIELFRSILIISKYIYVRTQMKKKKKKKKKKEKHENDWFSRFKEESAAYYTHTTRVITYESFQDGVNSRMSTSLHANIFRFSETSVVCFSSTIIFLKSSRF